MEANKTFDIRVRCTNKQLLEYIKSSLTYGNEIIPGLEFVSFIEPIISEKETIITQPTTNTNKHIQAQNVARKQNNYNSGWVDIENKSAMQNMFDSIII